MSEKIIILDFGSQYTQLIARRVRDLTSIVRFIPIIACPILMIRSKELFFRGAHIRFVIKNAPQIDYSQIQARFPLLAVCYGAQYIAQHLGGEVSPSEIRDTVGQTYNTLTMRMNCLRVYRFNLKYGCPMAIPSEKLLTILKLLPVQTKFV